MMRIYCDKNIYSTIKEGKKNYNPALKKLMEQLKDTFIFTYSHAHHEDLANSDKAFWEEDLLLLERYAKDHYFNYDPIRKFTDCLLAKPTESFYDTDFDVAKIFLSLKSNLMETLFPQAENGSLNDLKEFMNILWDISLPPFENIDQTSKENKILKKFFPSDDNLTIGNILECLFSSGKKLLTDKQEVIDIKKSIEEYVSSDKYSFEKWKDQFDLKFQENFKDIAFTEMMNKIFDNIDSYNDYDKFIFFFNSLELYNITKDKPLRKTQSLNSITIDANHAWYASFSDFLITEDKGLSTKAYITYKFFNIRTRIYNVNEFLDRGPTFLRQEENKIDSFFGILDYELENSLILKDNIDNILIEQSIRQINSHIFFNYFNRIYRNKNSITLYCQRHVNANFTMYREAELLTNKIVKLFGADCDHKGYFDFSNENPEKNIIRTWIFNELKITFGNATNDHGHCYFLEFLIE
ncbi:hypothetical protein A1704_03845 [Chryseobacterium cucumeris]|uniref:hypothetical protein n=1 Tax=Chryseobacterium cucumeris TaxID=1813611 RepID=UPI000789047C|nr:hypothetical protein [Chryseobacterium cucumeris]KYH07808.1 hypothetical protein A1704_03845 [Chryseobacterium cucumeris]